MSENLLTPGAYRLQFAPYCSINFLYKRSIFSSHLKIAPHTKYLKGGLLCTECRAHLEDGRGKTKNQDKMD